MKQLANRTWLTARGPVLALLGVAAAYALSHVLDGFGWRAGLGLITFLTTVLAVGTFGFRMRAEDAVEEAATAIRAVLTVAFAAAALTATLLTALTGSNPTTT
ncbi:hypothetical protein [Streptomyces sp. sk2.1]|uniref:hypothetical protein n=1 Tax=Streptomyces sp. sk2.1 TaxID=2478959 RepID=UPI0011E73A05|nr:hypothetical protein [Streptomyces sp. sk2.1]TXS58826.1 hypothetical protein EAO76_42970 [Streptomyces sp. sk2.1]